MKKQKEATMEKDKFSEQVEKELTFRDALESLETFEILSLINDASNRMQELTDAIQVAHDVLAQRDYEKGLF